MKHSVPHTLDQALARKAADRAFDVYSRRFAKYEPKATWVSEHRCEISFSAKGLKLRGFIELAPGAVELDLEVPFLLRVFKSQAIHVIEGEIRKWLDRAQAGTL